MLELIVRAGGTREVGQGAGWRWRVLELGTLTHPEEVDHLELGNGDQMDQGLAKSGKSNWIQSMLIVQKRAPVSVQVLARNA